MNILLLDNDENTIQVLNCFLEINPTWNLKHFKHLKKESTDYSDFDFLIADFSNKEHEKESQLIMAKNKAIKIIMISDKLEHCVSQGCASCVEDYNLKRLIKPLEPLKLLDLINDFETKECGYYDAFNQPKTIIPLIVKRFICLEYDSANQIITIDAQCTGNRHTVEILSFIHILEQNSIAYQMTSENSIKLKF